MDRKQEYNDYAEYREQARDCRLALKFQWDMPGEPAGQPFWVAVAEPVYDKYSDLDMAIVYRSLTDLCEFVREGE